MKEWLQKQNLVSGEPIPSARSLARQLDVDPRTVCTALDLLTQEGLITQLPTGRRVVSNSLRRSSTMAGSCVAVLTGENLATLNPRFQAAGWSIHLEWGVRKEIEAAGAHALMFNSRMLREHLPGLAEEGIQALVVADPKYLTKENLALLREVRKSKLPVTIYSDTVEVPEFDCVQSDHALGTSLLIDFLVKRGVRRPLLMLPEVPGSQPWIRARRRGYEQACKEHGLEPLPSIMIPDVTSEWGKEDLFRQETRLLAGYLAEPLLSEESPDAILLVTDGHFAAVAAACRILKRNPGTDILIAGYDNYWIETPEIRYESTRPVATIDKENETIGAELVRTALKRANKQLSEESANVVISPRLVVIGANGDFDQQDR